MARVPVELDDNQLKKAVAVVKKSSDDDSDASKFDAIQAAIKGISRPMAAKLLYAAEVVINPRLKIKLSAATYRKAKADGLREERIAARSGRSVTQLKAWMAENNIDPIYSGKGRRFDGSAPAGNSTKKATKPAASKKPAAKPKPAGKVRKRAGLKPRPSRT